MSEPPLSDDDDLGPGATTDQPLSLGSRTAGPRGLSGKIALAALGLAILFAMVAAAWIASHYAPQRKLERPPAEMAPR